MPTLTRDRRAIGAAALAFGAVLVAACIPPQGEPPVLSTTSTTGPPTSLDAVWDDITGSGCFDDVCNFYRELVITNLGPNATTAPPTITFSNNSAPLVELSTPNDCTGTLAVGESCTVVVHFRNSTETYTGTLDIDAGNTSYNAAYDAREP